MSQMQARDVVGIIDFTLAHLGPPESDISFALWVTGRTEQPARRLDGDRLRWLHEHREYRVLGVQSAPTPRPTTPAITGRVAI